MKTISILSFTERGKLLAEKLSAALNKNHTTEVFDRRTDAKAYLSEHFAEKDVFIFICAAGIAVRLIAPLIRGKDVDPAVVVMDEFGRYAIPILSGHLGGANEAAAEIAELTGAQVILTTATDINGKFAVDVWSKYAGCKIMDVSGIKTVSSAVLAGEKIGIHSGFPFEGNMQIGRAHV